MVDVSVWALAGSGRNSAAARLTANAANPRAAVAVRNR